MHFSFKIGIMLLKFRYDNDNLHLQNIVCLFWHAMLSFICFKSRELKDLLYQMCPPISCMKICRENTSSKRKDWLCKITNCWKYVKKKENIGIWSLTAVILATQEAEIRRIMVRSRPGQIVHKPLSWKTHHKKGLAERFKVKALSLSSSTEKKRKKEGTLCLSWQEPANKNESRFQWVKHLPEIVTLVCGYHVLLRNVKENKQNNSQLPCDQFSSVHSWTSITLPQEMEDEGREGDILKRCTQG
jgi:hypothetical protein